MPTISFGNLDVDEIAVDDGRHIDAKKLPLPTSEAGNVTLHPTGVTLTLSQTKTARRIGR